MLRPEQQQQQQPAAPHSAVSELVGVSSQWLAKLVAPQTWYPMSSGIRRLAEFIQVRRRADQQAGVLSALSEKHALCCCHKQQGTCSLSEEPVWLLGLWYAVQNADANTSSLTPEVRVLACVWGRGRCGCACTATTTTAA